MPDHPPHQQRTRPTVLLRRYELGQLLGRGGMAEVYNGTDLVLGRRVAIKLLSWASDQDRERAERLRTEASAAASLNHPNVVAVHDIGSSRDVVFVVMEYLEGETLRDLLKQRRFLPAESAAVIAAQVCSALEAAHQRGLVHRDITPANIMVCDDGAVKVMDFGIARVTGEAFRTTAGLVLGTPAYMSPEQAQSRTIDGRSDLYSLGCCLYQMLTGRPPFVGSDPVAVAYQHVKEHPPPPREVNPAVPAELETTVLRAMAKRPDDRYLAAAEMRADLEAIGATDTPRLIPPARTLPLPVHHGTADPGDPQPGEVTTAESALDEHDAGVFRRQLGVTMIVLASVMLVVAAALMLYH